METRTGNRVKVPFYKRSKFQDGVFIATLVAVPLISFCVFWLYVNLDTVAMTFQRYNVRTGEYEWYGFERYIEVFRTYVFGLDGAVAEHNAFLNTFRAILINIIIFPLAYISAYAFYKKIPCEKFFRVCFYIPSIISITVLTLLYRYMFHPDFGPVNTVFQQMGVNIDWLGENSDVKWTLIYIFSVWAGLGVNVIMMNSAMLRIPEEIIEYSKLEGVGFWRESVQIVLPLIMPTVGIYLLNILLSVFTFTLQPMLIAGTGGVNDRYMTVGWMILQSVSSAREARMLLASTVGMVLTIIVLPFIIVARILINKSTPDVEF